MARFLSLLVLLAAVLAACLSSVRAQDTVAVATGDDDHDELEAWTGRDLLESMSEDEVEKKVDKDLHEVDDGGKGGHDKVWLLKKLKWVKLKIKFWKHVLKLVKHHKIVLHKHKHVLISKIKKIIRKLVWKKLWILKKLGGGHHGFCSWKKCRGCKCKKVIKRIKICKKHHWYKHRCIWKKVIKFKCFKRVCLKHKCVKKRVRFCKKRHY